MRSVLLAVLMCAGLSAARASANDELNWLCTLNTRPDFALHCRLESDPALDDELPQSAGAAAKLPSEAELIAPVDQAQIRRTLFAPGAAPNVARLVREQPTRYRAMAWMIPLYGPPVDEAQVRTLAQSVLCGPAAACQAHFGSAPLSLRTAAR